MFLAFLLAACQVLVHLYAGSFVGAAAFDVARLASAAEPLPAEDARSHGLELLGGFAVRVSTFEVHVGARDVTVRVRADSPALLPRAFGRIAGTASIDRTVTLRREQPRCPGC